MQPWISPQRRATARSAALLDDVALLRECHVDVLTVGGPGGQHRNKAETGIRLTHPPTELSVTATERRSQAQNRSVATERLREALTELGREPKVRRKTKRTRGSNERRLDAKKRASATKQLRKDKW